MDLAFKSAKLRHANKLSPEKIEIKGESYLIFKVKVFVYTEAKKPSWYGIKLFTIIFQLHQYYVH